MSLAKSTLREFNLSLDLWCNSSQGEFSQEMAGILLGGGILLQRVQLDVAIDQSGYNAENGGVL